MSARFRVFVGLSCLVLRTQAQCDASTLLANAADIGDCTSATAATCTQTPAAGFACSASSCAGTTLTDGTCAKSCLINERWDGSTCAACTDNYVRDAGDAPFGAAKICNPRKGFRVSFDAAGSWCRAKMQACVSDADGACLTEVLTAFDTGAATCQGAVWPGSAQACGDSVGTCDPTGVTTRATCEVMTGQVKGVFTSTAAYTSPDKNAGYTFSASPTTKLTELVLCLHALEAPPPPPDYGVGGVTGKVSVDIGGLFPLTGLYCGQGWHARFGAEQAIKTLACQGGLASMITNADAKRFGLDVASAGGGVTCTQTKFASVTLHTKDTGGSVPQALYDADILMHMGVDAFVGPMVSEVAEVVSALSMQDHVPVVGYRSSMSKLTESSVSGLNHFMRTFPSDRILMKGVVDLIQHHRWEAFTFITTNDEHGMDAARQVREAVTELQDALGPEAEQTIKELIVRYVEPNNPEDIRKALEATKEGDWRIIVLHAREEIAPRILHQAASLRMLKMGWCWIGTEWATSNMFRHNVTKAGLPDRESTDGTAAYLRAELQGLVAIQVARASSATATAMQALWATEKATYIDHTLCAEAAEQDDLGAVASFAYDAVLTVASGARTLADQRAAMVPPGQGHWWRGKRQGLKFGEARGPLMTAMLDTSANLANGNLQFDQSGNPIAVKIEIVNYNNEVFATVGTWIQTIRDYEDCDKDLLCGVLKVDDRLVTWMGEYPNVPSDRVVEHDAVHAIYMTLVITALLISILGGNFIELIHFAFLPEAGFTVIIGFLVGLLVKLYGMLTASYHMEELAAFDEKMFALVLLPIIIFDAGFGAKKQRFFSNIGPIMTTALLGTTISTVVIGMSIFYLGDITEVRMGMAESLTFGALISAVDPVATLAIFGVLKVEPNLNYRVFGESLINDAVSIVLFRVFGHFIVQEVTTWEVFKAIFTFLKISLGSLFLGVGVAILASLVMKVAHIHDPLLAAGTFIIWSYISYEVVEALHLSGIIASLFCGFGMSHYALKNIAEQYHEMVHDMVHMMACMADLGIFFSVGVNVVLMAPYDKWMFIAVSMGLCLVGRMCNIFPLCGLYNIFVKKEKRIGFKDQLVMVHAGLRGAIAFALALGFPTQHQRYVIDATTWVVLITVFVFGGSTITVLKALGIEMGAEDEKLEKLIDLNAMRQEFEGSTKFNATFKFCLFEYKLQRCIVRTPEEELGIFVLAWDELTQGQRDAALALGYSDDPDVVARTWPHNDSAWTEWVFMEEEEKANAMVLGLNEFNWPPPDFSLMYEADQGVKQHASGHDVGFGEESPDMKREKIAQNERERTSNPLNELTGEDSPDAKDSPPEKDEGED